MEAKFVFLSHKAQDTTLTVSSVQEARGLAKRMLRKLGRTAWAMVFVGDLRITISQSNSQWQVVEEVL